MLGVQFYFFTSNPEFSVAKKKKKGLNKKHEKEKLKREKREVGNVAGFVSLQKGKRRRRVKRETERKRELWSYEAMELWTPRSCACIWRLKLPNTA